MRRMFAYLMCGFMVCVCLLLAACQKGGADSGSSGPGESGVSAVNVTAAPPEKEWLYVPEFITVGDDRASYEDMQLVGDTVCYVSMVGEAEGEEQKICRYSLTDRELTKVSAQWPIEEKNLEICSFVFNADYSVWLIVNAYSADYSQLKRYLCRFDSDGKSLVSQDITEEMGRGSYVGEMAVDGQGRIYVFTSEYAEGGDAGMWLYTEEGSYQGMLYFGASDTVRVRGTVNGENGRFCVCISEGESTDHCTMLEVDFEGKRLTEVIEDFPNINGLCMGKQPDGDLAGLTAGGNGTIGGSNAQTENYDLLLYDDEFVYGYDFSVHQNGSGQTIEELFPWTDSDINGYFVENLSILEDGRYYATVEDWENEDRCIVLLRKTRGEEVIPGKKLVLAAVNGGSSLTALAVNFNRSQEQYHLDIRNFDSLTDLYNAILTKEPMDIIDLSGVNVENLLRQGIWEDLRPYLERSETLAPSDFVEGILDTYTIDGTLVGIPDSFTLQTVAGDRTLLGEDTALTLDNLFTLAERNPGALPIGEVTKEEVMQYLMIFNQDAFIDWETGECRFDSPRFQAVLEFVNRFPDTLETNEEESLPAKIHNGQVLFAVASLFGPGSFQRYEGMFGETAACVGFPTMEGKGGTLLYPQNAFGITAMSEYKEGAWAFIESVLDPGEIEKMDPQKVYSMYWVPERFPSLKKTMNIISEYVVETDREWAEKGRNFGFLTYSDGWIIEFHAITREEIDALLNLVKEAKPFYSVEEDEIIRIISEEAAAFYSGQKSPEEVMKIIQNRIQLYVNEHR